MKAPETTTGFAGVDARTRIGLSEWYKARHESDGITTFAEAIRSLPRATETKVAYENPYTCEWVGTDRHNVVVEPGRLIDQATDEEGTDPLFSIPTDTYPVIDPIDVYSPLEDVLRAETYDDTPLSELVFGMIRQYCGGGEVHMDLMFDGLSVSLPSRNEPITMVVTSGYDCFGSNAVYVEEFGRDSYCANSIRSLTDREAVEHVGAVDGFEPWSESVLS